ncbi:MAG: hypothetical protein J6A49_06805 [Clostridia bacterium]|nr:hypothetical protein [Clostridia bacterium]
MADFDISSILNSLSAEDIENIKKAASGFLGNMGETQEKPKEKKQENNGMPFSDALSGLGMPDLSQLASLAPILQAFNSHDERLDFINALKPLLSEERRHKADEAMKLVKLLSVLPLLRERGIM